MDKKLGCMRLKWRNTKEKDYRAVEANELTHRTELDPDQCVEEKSLCSICSVEQVVSAVMV